MADEDAGRRFANLQERVAREMSESAAALTRERHADVRIERFRNGVTGAGVSLSQPATQADGARANSASLSERRDTAVLATDPRERPATEEEHMTKDKQPASGDEARTGENADDNREELIKQAEEGLKKATRDLPSDADKVSD
jgi:hypothetical protein